MIDEPTKKIKEEIYQLYTQIYDSSFDKQKKKNLLTSIAGWEQWSWRVVGITVNAVGRILDHKGHARVKSELVRDHFFQGRSKTYENMLNNKLDFENYWKEFWENDRTILMTKEEHNTIKTDKYVGLWHFNQDKIFEIDWRHGYFISNKVAGFHFTYKREGQYIFYNFKDKVIQKVDNSKSKPNNIVYYYTKKISDKNHK